MRYAIVALVVLVSTLTARADSILHRVRADASGCVASTIGCTIAASPGELAAGDCAFSDGTRYDTWNFAGSKGQVVRVKLIPIDATLTTPLITIDPPTGDASITPVVGGSGTPTLWYRLSSTGTWRIVVGTADLFSGGKYSLSLSCYGDSYPSDQQNCISQELECGQSALWSVTATSCHFTGTSQGFASYQLGTLKAGDSFTIQAHSDAFDPGVAIYPGGGGSAIASAFGTRYTKDATLPFLVPTAGNSYYFVVFGPNVNSAGEFFVQRKICSAAPCVAPRITAQPIGATVAYGGSYTFTVGASGDSPLQFEWFEGTPPDLSHPLGAKSGASLLPLTNLVAGRNVWSRVSNSCGSVNSAGATVYVERPPHRRAARH